MNRKEEVDRLVGAYQDVISHPTVVSGRISESGVGSSIIVSSVWTQRSLERGQVVKTQRTDFVTENSASNITTVEINEQMSSWSPSGRLRCVVRQITDAEKTKQFLEVWESDRIWKNFDVAAFDLHGEIYTDDEFGSLQWDPSEKKISYVAEKKKPQARPFYKQGAEKDENQSALGEEYAYVEDWGEQLDGKSQPVIAVCDLVEDVLKLVPGLPDKYSPGQLVWNKTGDGLFGLGLENTPRRLGLVYCTHTPGAIFHLSLEGAFSILTANGVAPRSPRLSPDGSTLVWLQRTAGGPPDACMQLISMDLPFKKTRVILDIVKESSAEFPGIYSRFLPPRCFSNDGLCVVVNTNVYKAAAIRNPVVDVASRATTTDIPDWAWVESGLAYTPDAIPDDSQYLKMRKMSPIQHVQHIRAPILFFVGTKDLRVPPTSQAVNIYKILKARGTKTKLLMYKDNHSLATVPVHFDALLNATLWILDSLNHALLPI